MLNITALTASILSLIFIKLSFGVIFARRKNQVSLGDGGFSDLQKTIRAHGNFAEYVPLSLILLACLELNLKSPLIVCLFASALIIGRILHASGIQGESPNFKYRLVGMVLTFSVLGGLAAANTLVFLFK